MARYAEGTDVPVFRSKAEIEKMIRDKGGINVSYGGEEDADPPYSFVRFKLRGYVFRFNVAISLPNEREFTHDQHGYARTAAQAKLRREQEERRRWRELVLILKSMLISLDSKVVSFEKMFGMFIELEGDQTVGDLLIPRFEELKQRQLGPGDVRARVFALPAPKEERDER